MKRIGLTLASLFYATIACANNKKRGCDLVGDSRYFYFQEVDLVNQGASTSEEKAKLAIANILRKSCHKEYIHFSKPVCKEVDKYNPFSVGCYIESKLGYFFVHYDIMGNAHTVWSRWD